MTGTPVTGVASPGAGWLAGKRTLVIGAGSGIGLAVAEAFTSEGAEVAILERDPVKCEEVASTHPPWTVVRGDATTYESNVTAVEACVESFGGLDVLVNCVGIFDFYRGVDEIDPDELLPAFEEIYRVNVASQILGVKAALGPLRESRGNIVLTVSTSGFYPGRGGVMYVSSKFAVRGLVVTLAHDLAPTVRVNGVAPGGTLGTDLRGPQSLALHDRRLDDGEGRAEAMRRRTPLEVAMTGADHAGSYVFLASDRAAGITGTFLHPDGGIGVKG